MQLLASLVDSRNSILVPGFYANVRPNMLDAALPRLEASHEFSLDGCARCRTADVALDGGGACGVNGAGHLIQPADI